MIMLSTDYEACHFAHLASFSEAVPMLYVRRASNYDAILDSLDFLAGRGDDIETITLLEPPCPFRNGKLTRLSAFIAKPALIRCDTKPVDDVLFMKMSAKWGV